MKVAIFIKMSLNLMLSLIFLGLISACKPGTKAASTLNSPTSARDYLATGVDAFCRFTGSQTYSDAMANGADTAMGHLFEIVTDASDSLDYNLQDPASYHDSLMTKVRKHPDYQKLIANGTRASWGGVAVEMFLSQISLMETLRKGYFVLTHAAIPGGVAGLFSRGFVGYLQGLVACDVARSVFAGIELMQSNLVAAGAKESDEQLDRRLCGRLRGLQESNKHVSLPDFCVALEATKFAPNRICTYNHNFRCFSGRGAENSILAGQDIFVEYRTEKTAVCSLPGKGKSLCSLAHLDCEVPNDFIKACRYLQ